MSKVVQIYPSTDNQYYFQDANNTTNGGGLWAFAGLTSYTYLWPSKFDLSPYANKVIRRLEYHAKRDASESNAVGKTINAGISTLATLASVQAHSNLNNGIATHGSGDEWHIWDISGGWNELKQGVRYVVLWSSQASSYTAFMTTIQSGTTNDPYIELEYDEMGCQYCTGGAYHQCQAYKCVGGVYVPVQLYKCVGGVYVPCGG